ncbi:MAG: multiple sugar transport system permease protein [Verrucomicrobiota bacterium]
MGVGRWTFAIFTLMMRRALIYAALALGSIIFTWPFIWMAATSAKLERELFRQQPRTLPQSPGPRLQSPYVDTRLFADVNGTRMDETLSLIGAALSRMNYTWPQDLNPAELRKEASRGIYARLLNTLPADHWQKSSAELGQEIAAAISPQLIADIVANLRRVFCVGQLRIRSYDLQEEQLIAGQDAAANWVTAGSAPARLVSAESGGDRYAELHYDFSQGDLVTLSQTFTTSFPVSRLHRIQLYLRNDDTWHAITLFVERSGQRLQAQHPVDDCDYNWIVDTWQEPGPDDRLDKIRTWTLLRPIASGPQFTNGPNQIKISVELSRRNLGQAWAAKILHNYRLTFDYIPFWRYVETSLFLVILNLAGTLISCSLVAYSFARLQWPGRTASFALLLGTMMIPPQVTMIPQFLIFQKLGWYNTLKPLWVMSFFTTAFSVFLIRQFMKGIPRDLEDAARIDGCGFLRIYWHIILPLIKPALAVVAIFTFLATWNDFMGPLIYLNDQRLYPLSFGLYAFQIQSLQPGTMAGIGMLMAGSLLMTLPVIAIFFFAQRYFLQGVTLTGIKG